MHTRFEKISEHIVDNEIYIYFLICLIYISDKKVTIEEYRKDRVNLWSWIRIRGLLGTQFYTIHADRYRNN